MIQLGNHQVRAFLLYPNSTGNTTANKVKNRPSREPSDKNTLDNNGVEAYAIMSSQTRSIVKTEAKPQVASTSKSVTGVTSETRLHNSDEVADAYRRPNSLLLYQLDNSAVHQSDCYHYLCSDSSTPLSNVSPSLKPRDHSSKVDSHSPSRHELAESITPTSPVNEKTFDLPSKQSPGSLAYNDDASKHRSNIGAASIFSAVERMVRASTSGTHPTKQHTPGYHNNTPRNDTQTPNSESKTYIRSYNHQGQNPKQSSNYHCSNSKKVFNHLPHKSNDYPAYHNSTHRDSSTYHLKNGNKSANYDNTDQTQASRCQDKKHTQKSSSPKKGSQKYSTSYHDIKQVQPNHMISSCNDKSSLVNSGNHTKQLSGYDNKSAKSSHQDSNTKQSVGNQSTALEQHEIHKESIHGRHTALSNIAPLNSIKSFSINAKAKTSSNRNFPDPIDTFTMSETKLVDELRKKEIPPEIDLANMFYDDDRSSLSSKEASPGCTPKRKVSFCLDAVSPSASRHSKSSPQKLNGIFMFKDNSKGM